MLIFAQYSMEQDRDGTLVPVCLTLANTVAAFTFFLMTISIFFILPLMVLIILYAIIAKNLILSDSKMKMRLSKPEHSLKARKQVILMLGAVVLSFFACLLPFRMLTLWIIFVTDETFQQLNAETYYSLLLFCRIMWYLNSAVNPILYNLMSSKFRKGFFKLCRCCLWKRKRSRSSRTRRAMFNTATMSSYLTSSHHRRSIQSTRTALSLDDLRIHKQIKMGRLENSSTTSPTSGSDDESWYGLNLQRQASSPLLNYTHKYRDSGGKKSQTPSICSAVSVKSPNLSKTKEVLYPKFRSKRREPIRSIPKNDNLIDDQIDLRRLAMKNKMQKGKNISLDDSALCLKTTTESYAIDYRQQKSADESMLSCHWGHEVSLFQFIDETPSVDKSLLETLSPLLDQQHQRAQESLQNKRPYCR